jgi:hypothetical protein
MSGLYSIIASDGTCQNSASVNISVVNSAVPAIVSSPAGNSVCPGDAITLNASIASSNYSVSSITYAPQSTAGTPVALSDDQLSGALPIGFSFNFYGNNYTSFYISSNGFLSFNGSAGSGCCSGQSLPNVSQPNNVIALAWEDFYPPAGGSITYYTQGVAPNRQLIISYNNIQHYFSGNPVTIQAI